MVLGVQTKKKWKRSFNVEDLFSLHILFMQIAGHWPVDYTKVLPSRLAFLNKYINYAFMFYVSFLNGHMVLLYFINFLIDSKAEASVTQISDSLMSTILHSFGCFGGAYIQLNHKKLKHIFNRINESFRMRSSRGKF